MLTLSDHFTNAAHDYLFLLEKGYPQKTILKMVGDRYQLPGYERSMLFRGITTIENCEARAGKRVDKLPRGSILHIDGYNVIRTMGAYLMGKPVFVSMDGYLRDAAEMHRSTLHKKVLDKSLTMLIKHLSECKPEQVKIYLDEPVSKSGELASRINKLFDENNISGSAFTVHSPDHHLKQISKGFVCTADSAIIDHCLVKENDLAQNILTLNFDPEFINFERMKI